MNIMTRLAGMTAMGGLAMVLLGSPAQARPPRQPRGLEPVQEDLQETIEIYMIARMTRVLELTDDQQHAVIPVVERLNASRRDFNQKRRMSLMKLRPMLEEDPVDERAIVRLMEDLDDGEARMRQDEAAAKETLRASLTPVQQAKFMLFQERFRQEMKDRLRRVNERPGREPDDPPPPPGRRNPR